MTEGLAMASTLPAYLWWPTVVLGVLAAGAVLARLFLKHADKLLFVLVGFSLFWLVSHPDEATRFARTVGGALVGIFWGAVAFWTSLVR